jgi:hypothetical protein
MLGLLVGQRHAAASSLRTAAAPASAWSGSGDRGLVVGAADVNMPILRAGFVSCAIPRRYDRTAPAGYQPARE